MIPTCKTSFNKNTDKKNTTNIQYVQIQLYVDFARPLKNNYLQIEKIILSIFFLLILGCNSVNKTSDVDYDKMTKEEFLKQPFGFKENIESFTNNTAPTFRKQKLLRKNKHYPEKTDTIYQFIYKKSEIFFYKTHLGQEFLLAGKILNKQISLTNDIKVGLSKKDFQNRFSDDLEIKSDTLEMIGDGTKYTFIFDNDKLYRINIDNYFD